MTTASQRRKPPPSLPAFTPADVPGREAGEVVIAQVTPCIDCGKFPIKRTPGGKVTVEADILKDGHDVVAAVLQWRAADGEWSETPMKELVNDRWVGTFSVPGTGSFEYRITAWGDRFASWQHEIHTKLSAGLEDLLSETLEGAAMVEAAAQRAASRQCPSDAVLLSDLAKGLKSCASGDLLTWVEDPVLAALMSIHGDRSLATSSPPLPLWSDRPLAACAAWYEFFPRSAGGKETGSTFRDCIERIDDARAMGFDVIYFPPIHPIGEIKRKGRNNALTCEPGDPGVPYAIGNRKQGVNGGGHKDVAPELGTLEDFDWLVSEIHARGMEVALDFAINCSPDHPYVHDHPEWFFKRPDGSIKFAENPPKKYEDVFPLNFHNPDWRGLWQELHSVMAFWCARGVRVFRVDNPHTKPVAFWEWVIAEILSVHPNTIFLSEAFTRPKMMQTLAKAGFTQSYTYFTWRNSKYEIEEYLTELATSEMKEYFRPNFFTNTPDILPTFLQTGGRPAFCIRAILAATLSPVYGIYSGFELCENTPIPGREEYLDSEKYHFAVRDWNAPGNIKELLTRLNAIRRENRALQSLTNLRFHPSENENILCYSKVSEDGENLILCVVSHDPHHAQSGFVTLPLTLWGISGAFLLDDLLTGETFRWQGERNFAILDPHTRPAHIFRIRRPAGRLRGEPVFE